MVQEVSGCGGRFPGFLSSPSILARLTELQEHIKVIKEPYVKKLFLIIALFKVPNLFGKKLSTVVDLFPPLLTRI